MRLLLVLLIASALPLTAQGVEVSLRTEATLSESVVRLGDVADLSAAEPAEIEELAAVTLMPAPAAGSRQFLAAPQLRDLLMASGVDASRLTFSGADAVAIGSPATIVAKPGDDSGPAISTPPDAETAMGHVQTAIVRYLTEITGHELWNVAVDAEAAVAEMYWQQGPQLTVSGGRDPWIGRQQFLVGGARAARGVRVYCKVEKLEMIAFAVRAIPAGDLIRAADVAMRPFAGVVPAQAVRSLDEVIGKEATQQIRADGMLLTRNVRAPILVRRGERVAIKARAAGIVVRTFATAQQNGCLGDLMPVQAVEGKASYMARVSGLRELEVFAGGASAEEVAAAAR